MPEIRDPEFSGGTTTLTIRNEVANFCAAMATLIDEDGDQVMSVKCGNNDPGRYHRPTM